MVDQLRAEGFQVIVLHGDNNNGLIGMRSVEIPRKKAIKVIACARFFDPDCFYIIDDVRAVSRIIAPLPPSVGWRMIAKKY